MMHCDNSDHDGEQVPATAVIILEETATARCTYCAEGYMTSLVRRGVDFRVQASAYADGGL